MYSQRGNIPIKVSHAVAKFTGGVILKEIYAKVLLTSKEIAIGFSVQMANVTLSSVDTPVVSIHSSVHDTVLHEKYQFHGEGYSW